MKRAVELLVAALVLMFAVQAFDSWELQHLLTNGHTASAQTAKQTKQLVELETDIAKALFVEVGDGVEENVTFRNEQCANDEALAGSLDRILDTSALLERVTRQCAVPFHPPTIQVNGKGVISNKTGLPPGI